MEDDNVLIKQWQMKFNAAKWRRYHTARAAHYERLDRWVTFLSVVLGSTSIINVWLLLFSPTTLSLWVAAIVAVMNAAKLVFEFSRNAQLHRDMFRDFTALAMEISETLYPDFAQCRKWESQMIAINGRMYRIFWALEAHCYNQTVVEFSDNMRPPLELGWRGRFKNLFLFSNDKFRTQQEQAANDLRPVVPPRSEMLEEAA